MLNNNLRLYALRILGHAKTAVDGPNPKVRKRAIDFALSNAPKLEATVDAIYLDQLFTKEKREELVALIRRFQLECAPPVVPPSLEEAPAANDVAEAANPPAPREEPVEPRSEAEPVAPPPAAVVDPSAPRRSSG